MHLLDLTLPTPAENLALDEALLESAGSGVASSEVLRLWESPQPIVVVGRASQLEQEVKVGECLRLGVPVLRRPSGGAAIVAGPGCLMYAVVLSYEGRPHLRMIDQAHRYVLDTLASGLRPLLADVARQGISDLTIAGGMKFSGNSLRCARSHLLYHGTLLYNFPLQLIEQCLVSPPRQPEYRRGRSHAQFVRNIPLTRTDLQSAAIAAFAANESLHDWPRAITAQLAREKYSSDAWNLKR
jgi:lipoate-protein ligase A